LHSENAIIHNIPSIYALNPPFEREPKREARENLNKYGPETPDIEHVATL
jgi:hypothetical protein